MWICSAIFFLSVDLFCGRMVEEEDIVFKPNSKTASCSQVKVTMRAGFFETTFRFRFTRKQYTSFKVCLHV